MVAACHHANRFCILVIGRCGQRMFGAVDFNVGAQTGIALMHVAHVNFVLHRHTNNAKDRLMAIDQGNVHGEFAVAIDEFLCAIQWIHKPVARPLRPLSKRRRRRFFRNNRYLRGEGLQACYDDLMCRQIRLGQRRFITLGLNLKVCLVHLQDRCASVLDDLRNAINPLLGDSLGHIHSSKSSWLANGTWPQLRQTEHQRGNRASLIKLFVIE